MADRLSPARRSRLMSRVRSKGSLLERRFAAALRAAGLRFRANVANVHGRPDVVFRSARVAVFLDSCFWHGCRSHPRTPRSNVVYWRAKLRRNRRRDRAVDRLLVADGWLPVRVWEHELKDELAAVRAVSRIRRLLNRKLSRPE